MEASRLYPGERFPGERRRGDREDAGLFHSRPRSFDALYREYGDRIYRFSYRLCGNRADAEDLTQEVFVLAWQGLERFEGRSSLTTWLYRIALNRWHRIRSTRGPETVPLEEGSEAGTRDLAAAQVERLSLESAVAALPEPLREAFILVKAEGLKYREAAAVLEIPQGTVQSRVHDAVVQLRAALSEETAARTERCGDAGMPPRAMYASRVRPLREGLVEGGGR
jgi:RNA polymerase sigma-70 factor, ECF subfamily